MVPNDFSFDFFDECDVRYFKITDQFGKECWYDPKTDKVTPITDEDDFIPIYDYLKSQGKVFYDLKKTLRWDSKPSEN